MSFEEIEEKRRELSKTHNCVVQTIVLDAPEGDKVVGFLKEPKRIDKMQALDISIRSLTQAAAHIVTTSFLKDESDPRFMDEKPENDPIYLGLLLAVQSKISVYTEAIKKN